MIVIPMAGWSRRFLLAGYSVPKYLLQLGPSETVFTQAVKSFASYFQTEPFLFVVRNAHGTPRFVEDAASILGIRDARLVVLSSETMGQAMTVMRGLERIGCLDAEPLTIFNIDTFRPGFRYPVTFDVAAVDGFLEVFRGAGTQWSYVRPHPTRPWGVIETAEKRPLSHLCCTGLYYFRTASLFAAAYAPEEKRLLSDPAGGELYVAPLYNHLIHRGCDVRYVEVPINDVVFCGTPREYEALLGEAL